MQGIARAGAERLLFARVIQEWAHGSPCLLIRPRGFLCYRVIGAFDLLYRFSLSSVSEVVSEIATSQLDFRLALIG